MDRRVKYTRMVLNESLLKFLEQKEITRITVKELCLDADVNRSTYYAHFSDPFDQLNKLKAELLGDLATYTQQIDTQHFPASEHPYRVLRAILQYVDSRRHMFRTLLTKSGDHNVQAEILKLLGEKAFSIDTEQIRSVEERQYLLIFAANGCFGMFYHWLMEDDPVPAERMAHLMADFTRSIRI